MEITLHHSSLGHQAAIYSICAGTLDTLFTGDGNGWLVQWSIDDPAEGQLLAKTGERIFALARRGQELWAGTMGGQLIIFDLQVKGFRKIDAHQKGIFAIHVWQDQVLTLGGDGLLKYWSPDARLLASVPMSSHSLRAIACHPTEHIAALAASDSNIYLFDLQTKRLLDTLSAAHKPSAFCVGWLGEEVLVSGGRDAQLAIWDRGAGAASKRLNAHHYTINDLLCHPELNIFATASRDRSIKIWDKSTFALLKVIDATKYGTPNGSVNQMLWTRDFLVSVGDDRKVNWWHYQTGTGEAVSDRTITSKDNKEI